LTLVAMVGGMWPTLVGRGGGSGSGTIWWGWLGDGEVMG